MRLWITILLVTTFLSARDKIALLIGNNDYTFQPLANPLHDVDGIYKTLKEIGFKESNIKVLKNASKITMENALANFAQRATTAEIALIYFSGHGMQVNNINYMFPARTTATKPIHLRTLVDLDYFIQSASSAKYGIVLVDACRNNPLVKYFQNGRHRGATAKKGLGQVTPTTGQVVIGFATSAGDTADDGNGYMSPYAKALSVRLKESDDIRNVLGKVGKDVSMKYEQNPIYRSNLADSVFLSKKNVSKEILNLKLSKAINHAKCKEIIQLIKDGADINTRDSYGWTALMMSGGTNCSDEKYVDFLINNGAELDLVNSENETALIIISRSNGTTGATQDLYAEKNEIIMKKIIDAGANISIASNSGETLLKNIEGTWFYSEDFVSYVKKHLQK